VFSSSSSASHSRRRSRIARARKRGALAGEALEVARYGHEQLAERGVLGRDAVE